MNPCAPPIAAPSAIPMARATIHVYQRPNPRSNVLGIHSVWTIAIVYARKPSSEPTDRSMLRDTMMSTMPVAMMAIDELWTDRFQRLRAVRKSPPDLMLKPSQMTASAATIPNMRMSISVDVHSPRHVARVSAGRAVSVRTSAVIRHRHRRAPCGNAVAQGALTVSVGNVSRWSSPARCP